MTVLARLYRVIVESSGRLRPLHNAAILDGSICDRYFGCSRGMPTLWREACLKRVESDPVAGDPLGRTPPEHRT